MRIRTIKPEFWSSDDVAALSWEDRLLFIGLWSYVDDNGVGRDNARLIKSELFPQDDDNPRDILATVSRGLQTLSDSGLIVRYIVDGKAFLEIVNWKKHQRIDRPNKPRFPQYQADRDTLATHSQHTREDSLTGTGEQGNRGTGEQGNISCATADADCAPNPDATPEPKPEEYSQDFLTFWAAYPIRRNKRAAWRRWKEAIKRAPAKAIIAGAQAYANDPNREDRFTKYPEGWLNGDGWEDQQLPNRGLQGRDQTMLGWQSVTNSLAANHPQPQQRLIEGRTQ